MLIFTEVSNFFREVTNDRSILLKIKTDACAGTEYAVNYLEHVQAAISVNATRRGDLELFLTSPMGTRCDAKILSLYATSAFKSVTKNRSKRDRFQVHDPEPKGARRRSQGWLHEMAVHDDSQLGRVPPGNLAAGGNPEN